MCGIAGVVALSDRAGPPELDALRALAGALRHRGPDEFGIYRDRRAGLAHARLSIIDLTTGRQPLANEDESIWVVFNGEIFNYIELRAELEARGHRFRTRSDTEVIVHAWEEWGVESFERYNGQFAIALWDAENGTLVLARDRLGVRPLYVVEHEGRLWFASEVKALFAANPALSRQLDPVGLAETFTFWSVLAPKSVFTGVTELEPGHVRTYTGAHVVEQAFWQPSYPSASGRANGRHSVDGRGFTGSLDDAVERVRAALETATRLRLRSDVPVGSYLSGGLDSSLVAAMARRAKGDAFHTFSVRFEDAEYDETEFQRGMVAELGSHHHEVVVSRSDIAAVFPDVIRHTERPILRTAPAPLFVLSRLVRDTGIKVVLTGEGADEMFAGYDIFREGKIRRFWARQPGSERRPRLLERLYPYLALSPVAQRGMARKFFGRGLERYREPGFAHQTRWQTTAALFRLFSPEVLAAVSRRDPIGELLTTLPAEFSRWSPLAQDQYLEVRTLLSSYILASQGDRMAMAHSVEGRFPFLDADVVELANALPDDYKLRVLDEKHVVKRAAATILPARVLKRKKQPYRAPDALCFVGPKAPSWIHEVLSEGCLRDAGIFEPRAVRGLVEKCRAQSEAQQLSNTDNMALVGVLSTQLLYETFVRRAPAAPEVAIRTLVDRG
ncbi:MAG: asparagine synthase (glutamine-hydrolyzing) [Pseudomonadota bacterium]